jgi:hypothetical protein
MNRFRIDRGEQHVIPNDRQRKSKQRRAKDFDPRKYKKFSLNVPTPDDWCPTLEDGTVEVTVMHLNCYSHEDDKPTIRTCVWGGDDMGMERDEEFTTEAEAEEAYQRRVKEITDWAVVTFDMLKELGFVMA